MMNTFRYAFRFLRRQKHFTLINVIGLALPEALAVTVVKGDVTYGGPAVLDDGVWCKLGHGVYGVRVSTKILKSPCCSSENVGFWLDFCMFAPVLYLIHND